MKKRNIIEELTLLDTRIRATSRSIKFSLGASTASYTRNSADNCIGHHQDLKNEPSDLATHAYGHNSVHDVAQAFGVGCASSCDNLKAHLAVMWNKVAELEGHQFHDTAMPSQSKEPIALPKRPFQEQVSPASYSLNSCPEGSWLSERLPVSVPSNVTKAQSTQRRAAVSPAPLSKECPQSSPAVGTSLGHCPSNSAHSTSATFWKASKNDVVDAIARLEPG